MYHVAAKHQCECIFNGPLFAHKNKIRKKRMSPATTFKNTLKMLENHLQILIKIEYTLIYLFDACKVSNDDISLSLHLFRRSPTSFGIFSCVRFEIECVRTNLLMC